MLDFTHVDDIVQGIILGMNRPKYSTGVYNISYGNAVPLETVAKYITKCLGTGSVKVDPLNLEYPKRGSMNITKARTELGYKPTTHVFDGINELLS